MHGARVHVAGSLDPQDGIAAFGLRPADRLHEGELLFCPGQSVHPNEALFQELDQGSKMPCVTGRILEHIVREWSPGPVRTLKFLGECDPEVLLKESGKTYTRFAHQGGRDLRVEHTFDLQAEITIQQPQVVVSPV